MAPAGGRAGDRMAEGEPTRIGWIRQVLGSTVTIALDSDLAGVAPIYRGHLQPVGQVGSLIRIPQGLIDLIASVSLVGIAEIEGSVGPAEALARDERWLRAELIGQIDRGTGRFERGVGAFPSIDDPVHFATPDDLVAVFPPPGNDHLRLGGLAAADQVPVCLDAARLVVRHSAVVGSTGSGKTSAVATLLQRFASGGWSAANIVVVDPHGEYRSALSDVASIRSVLDDGDSRLRVPYWALAAEDIARIFVGSPGNPTFTNRFSELVAAARREFAESASWLNLDPFAVTADTPIPFDIRPVWHRLDWENRETRMNKADPGTACEVDPGDPATLRSSQFELYNPAGQAPHKGPLHGTYGTAPDLLRLGLVDPRLRFFQEPQGDPAGDDPLITAVQEWLGGTNAVSVLDFSGVPARAADLAIGVILNLLFELASRSPAGQPGIGRPSPVLVVLEEAHRYLGTEASGLTRFAANRIAREGRKYGIGVVLVTQRPTELPKTALAQVGTLVALRLSNAEDQGTIRAALPDSVAGLAAVLPSLRTGEAIVSGEAVVLPVRCMVDEPRPAPAAEDPSLVPWRDEPQLPDIAPPLSAWRGTYDGGHA